MSIEELRAEVRAERRRLKALEAELARVERSAQAVWSSQGFYGAYYVLSGLVLGIVASWIVLLLNMIGAPVLGEEPLKLLRVYSTILGGAKTAGSNQAVILMFALGVHTLTGAICGAPIHVFYSRYFTGQTFLARMFTGLWLGVLMWVVNFYGILAWLQPLVLNEDTSYIVENIPVAVAVLSHVAFTETLLLLQPFGIFNPAAHGGERGGHAERQAEQGGLADQEVR